MNFKRVVAMLAALVLLAGCEHVPDSTLSGSEKNSGLDVASEKESESRSEQETESEQESETETDETPTESPEEEPEMWYAYCNEYIGLRVAPNTTAEVKEKIYAGEVVTLLEWEGKFAKVSYQEETGYVMSSYIKPVDENYLAACLKRIPITNLYSYEQMMADIRSLATQYPRMVETKILGQSEEGRDIPVVILGKTDAKYHVLLTGATHGREHMTTWMLMAMTDYWLEKGLDGYAEVCFHVIPMLNPDGVTISQTGVLNEAQNKIYKNDLKKDYTDLDVEEYAACWKANALGVDINRNFPEGWENADDRKSASSSHFHGEKPLCSAEAKILADYTIANDFAATVSCHSMGNCIFYGGASRDSVNQACLSLAEAIREMNGYNERELYSMFVRNYEMLAVLAEWVQE